MNKRESINVECGNRTKQAYILGQSVPDILVRRQRHWQIGTIKCLNSWSDSSSTEACGSSRSEHQLAVAAPGSTLRWYYRQPTEQEQDIKRPAAGRHSYKAVVSGDMHSHAVTNSNTSTPGCVCMYVYVFVCKWFKHYYTVDCIVVACIFVVLHKLCDCEATYVACLTRVASW